ncbi:MAG: PARP-type zinc finger-containing protein [Myxococcota bacterium]|nr:PARP-type zinc finger-containing protein [Myxococcota bacterium]
MGNRIEVAKSGRSKCCTCNEVILKGTPRLSEEYNDIGIPDLIHRFYHLKCAAAVHPEIVAAALQHVDHGVVFDRAEIEAKIAPAVQRATEQRKAKYLAQQAEKEAKAKAIIVEADDTTNELLAQLEGNPEDQGTLAVVADQLQARGDIRGELIALQLSPAAPQIALEGDDDEETDVADLTMSVQQRSRRIAELMDKLSIPIDPGDKAMWGVGFIRRLELHEKNGTRLASLAPIWKHPSLRFLSELQLSLSSMQDASYIERLVELAPRSLRTLELAGSGYTTIVFTGISELVAVLPRLEHLALGGKLSDELAHPTVRRLDLSLFEQEIGDRIAPLTRFSPKALPAVDTIVLHRGTASLALSVATLGTAWFKKLTHFGWLRGSAVTEEDIAQLAKALGKKKLARLDLTGTKVPLELRDKLAKLATELVAPDLAIAGDQTVYIEHANKPEWGRGKLVGKKEGKIEVQFKKPIGLKVFKADAPFLKLLA